MIQAPWTEVGRLQQDVSQLQSEQHQKADKREIHSLNSHVARLERELGEVRAACDGLRFELSNVQEVQREILNVMEQMTGVIRETR